MTRGLLLIAIMAVSALISGCMNKTEEIPKNASTPNNKANEQHTSDTTVDVDQEVKRDVLYALLLPGEDEIVFKQLGPTSDPGSHLDGDIVYADVTDIVSLLAPSSELEVKEGQVYIDGKQIVLRENPAHYHGTSLYVPIKDFALYFRAYTAIDQHGSATIWSQEILQYHKQHGEPNAQVLIDAKAEGLID
jgi:hypothetical protein